MSTLSQPNGFGPKSLIPQLAEFMPKVEWLLDALTIQADDLEMDHIALRVNQFSQAQQAELEWLDVGKCLSRAKINGRPIVIIALNQAISLGKWQCPLIELPYPKEGKHYPNPGWEHVEFVLPCVCSDIADFERVVRARFPQLNRDWDALEKRGIKVKLSAPQGENERLANPTIAFSYQGVAIKLHPHSLQQIVDSER